MYVCMGLYLYLYMYICICVLQLVFKAPQLIFQRIAIAFKAAKMCKSIARTALIEFHLTWKREIHIAGASSASFTAAAAAAVCC